MLRVTLLCGLSCVGKTLGGELLSADLGFVHTEASATMRTLWRELGRELPLDVFAERSLSEDPSRVPLGIIERARSNRDGSLVVSGLRSPREIDVFTNLGCDVRLVVVLARPEVRLSRSMNRGRAGHPKHEDELLELDRLHQRMGLAEIIALPWASRVFNDGTIEEYRSALCSFVWK